MKKYLLSIFILSFLFLGLYAQDYQTVNSGRIAYFSFNDFSFLKIDSTKVFNGDSIFYPTRSLEKIGYECYTPYAPSWVGRKIIVRANGDNIYFNYNSDSIVIRTRAALNEKWTAYQIADSITITAEVTKYGLDYVLGLADIVKTIKFQMLDSVGNTVDNPVNQMQLLLSQHYGWKSALNFNLFPNLEAEYFPLQYFQTSNLIGLSNPKVGRQNLKWFDVYDFQPGDVLHVYETSFNCCDVSPCTMNYRRIIYTYLDRTNYPDSIVYHVDREIHKMITQYPDTVSTEVFHDTIREIVMPYPEFDILSGELVPFDDGQSMSFINQYINLGMECKSFTDIFHKYDNDSCWNMRLVDGGGYYEYIKGLGGGYYDYNEVCSRGLCELQYYKKGSKEWGIPFNFTGVETLRISNEIKVYPNPASEAVFIEANGYGTVTVALYSIGGNLVLSEDLMAGNQKIDVSQLNPGLYFYNIVAKNKPVVVSGKVTIVR